MKRNILIETIEYINNIADKGSITERMSTLCNNALVNIAFTYRGLQFDVAISHALHIGEDDEIFSEIYCLNIPELDVAYTSQYWESVKEMFDEFISMCLKYR